MDSKDANKLLERAVGFISIYENFIYLLVIKNNFSSKLWLGFQFENIGTKQGFVFS